MTINQRTPEWYEARRYGVTSTDIPAILGISPYRSEGDVAREKLGQEREPVDERTERRFRLGLALEDVIRAEDEIEHGVKLRRVNRLLVHRTLPWAMTSLDFERVGQRVIVEAKSSTSRAWDDGLPEDVEAQVRWQMGVAEYPAAHVVALRYGRDLVCFDLDHDGDTFEGIVRIAADFLARVKAGGPFAESTASVRRAFPRDDGSEVEADPETVMAVKQLLMARRQIKDYEELESALVAAIETRMGPASVMTGPGFRVTWKQAQDSHVVNWRPLAEGVLASLTEEQREALLSLNTEVRTGSRRFIVKEERDD